MINSVYRLISVMATREILEEIKDKDYLLKRAKRTRLPEDWVAARRARNYMGTVINLKSQQRDRVNEPQKFWRLVSSIVPNNRVNTGNINLVTNNETEPVDANETSDDMNKFFSSIGPKLAEKFNEPLRFYDRVQDNECLSFLTDFEEIHQLCREINTSKSSGFAQILAKVLKSAFLVLVPQLVHMFNASFSTGVFPTS